jgi:hypothetical protein
MLSENTLSFYVRDMAARGFVSSVGPIINPCRYPGMIAVHVHNLFMSGMNLWMPWQANFPWILNCFSDYRILA